MTDDAARYARIHAILERARTLSGTALDEHLADTCGDDSSLRAQILEMLAAGTDAEADDPLADRNVDQVRQALEQLLEAPDPDEEAGAGRLATPVALPRVEADWKDFTSGILERIGRRGAGPARYEIKGKLAAGGQGVVFRVWDEDLQRHLAMKVMLRQDDVRAGGGSTPVNAKTLGRFLEEAQVTGQLEHPGIVPVHELGLDAQGRVYFTMRLVKGDTLSTVFEKTKTGEGGYTPTRTLGVLLKVCDAMAYAHDKAVIHRDLKPSNVMVGRFGEVFVMDWGLARVVDKQERHDIRFRHTTTQLRSPRREAVATSGESDSPLLTVDGDVMGTPQYMPPEQAAGQIELMGPHSDVYSLGAMLYELLAGHSPYVKPGARPSAYGILSQVQAGPPEPLAELAPSAPPELVAICDHAMARPPRERYPHMAALAEDLSAFLENRVVMAHETGALAELRKWVVRNRALAGALGAALLMLVTGLIAALYLKTQSDRHAALASQHGSALEQANADLELRTREAERRRDEVMKLAALQDVEDLLSQADALWPARPDMIDAYTAWIETAQALVADLPLHRAKRLALRSTALPRTEAQLLAGDWSFPREEGEARWWNNQLSKLIGELEAIEARLLSDGERAVSAEHGWSITRRRAFAQRLRRGYAPGGEFALQWRQAREGLRRAYPGLDLVPQTGLVPLGADPRSGLWEFADLASGSIPRRDADGQLAFTGDSALVLVLLPAGSFTMGAQSVDPGGVNYDPRAQSNEGPPHEVSVSAFFLSKYEMTQGQWERFAGPNPSIYAPPNPRASSLLHPVETVSWYSCMETCRRLGLSLPSEAQWEYAARANTTGGWWTGAQSASLHTLGAANVADRAAQEGSSWMVVFEQWNDGRVVHAPVGAYAPNPFGLHDVHGNVWEWCLDAFSADFYAQEHGSDPVNAATASSRIVYRGGSFNAPAGSARSAYRDFDAPGLAHNSTGLRPARAVTR